VKPRAPEIVAILQDAESKGLNPEDYDGPRWSDRLAKPGEPLRFDLALTVCVMRYVSDLHNGRVNPGLYHSKFDMDNEHLSDLVRGIADSPNLRAALDPIEPPFDGYRNTLKALARYRVLARNAEREALPVPKKAVDPKGPYPAVPRLARLLQDLGDLPVIVVTPEDARIYDGPLVDAVKHFQSRHGLDADGRMGKATFAALNTPLGQRVRQLELTLERWRWVPHSFPRPPIVVNLPEFELRALNSSNQTDLEMKVVVGDAYDHKTPVFSADLKYVIFHPYWNVPLSIQQKELVPHIAKDRSYLAKHDYEVVTQAGRVVTSGAVSNEVLAQLRSGKLAMRQRPGPKNSLGSVKFVFPNANDVYLHDTPSTSLFAKSRRDASHGCIRVEKPEELANWVLRDEPGWSKERIADAMKSDKTLQVNLKEPIPVLLVYGTAVVVDDGEVHFYPDIYGYDSELDSQLSKGYPYRPAPTVTQAPNRPTGE
jgi:murein L,D-transpeptidase YcbB/YkuD